MQKISLHTIFSHLVNDPNFLLIIEQPENIVLPQKQQNQKKTLKDKKEPVNKTVNIMSDMISDYITLIPTDTQKYTLFPSEFKSILHPEYIRCGIKTFSEKSSMNVNVSFLNSLNILLRPELFKSKIDDQIKNYNLFEGFVLTKMGGNCRIDKVKNTKKIRAVNSELSKNLICGKITVELIQFIINIFEINLLIFDFVKNEILFFWSCGHKYPYINLFNDLHCMANIRGSYEPLMPINNKIPTEHIQKMYIKILTNGKDYMQNAFPINIAPHTLIQLETWDIPDNKYVKIIEKYFDQSFTEKIDYNV
jgi:hypothetical protein